MGVGLPAFVAAVNDFRTDIVTQDFVVTTNTTATTASIQLRDSLFNNNLDNAITTSNTTSDVHNMVSFTSGNRNLSLSGLSTNATRVISVEYKTAGLDGYTGADTGAKTVPVIMIVALIAVPLLAVVMIFAGR